MASDVQKDPRPELTAADACLVCGAPCPAGEDVCSRECREVTLRFRERVGDPFPELTALEREASQGLWRHVGGGMVFIGPDADTVQGKIVTFNAVPDGYGSADANGRLASLCRNIGPGALRALAEEHAAYSLEQGEARHDCARGGSAACRVLDRARELLSDG